MREVPAAVSAESADTASTLEDYLGLLEVLSRLGVDFVVIGGCAVGAYARLVGETVFSRDLARSRGFSR